MTITQARFIRSAIAIMAFSVVWVNSYTGTALSAEDDSLASRKTEAKKFFRKRVTPFIKKYWLECHQTPRPTEAGLSFDPMLRSPGHAAFNEKWKKSARPASQRVRSGQDQKHHCNGAVPEDGRQ